MPHMPEELWALYIQPSYLLLFAGLGGLLLVFSLFYWYNPENLKRRQMYLKGLLASHFLFWTATAYTFFLFFESIIEGDTFRFVDLTFTTLRVAVGLPVLLAFLLGMVLTTLGARKLQRNMLDRLKAHTPPSELVSVARELTEKLGLERVGLFIEETKAAYSMTVFGRPPVIVLTRGLLELLDSQELRAVIGHEVSHIANRDGFYKLFTTIIARCFYFDPLTRRLRASLCRDREYLADESAARITGDPLALASALLKLSLRKDNVKTPMAARGSYLSLTLLELGQASALSLLGPAGGWKAEHPPLRARLRRLVELYLVEN